MTALHERRRDIEIDLENAHHQFEATDNPMWWDEYTRLGVELEKITRISNLRLRLEAVLVNIGRNGGVAKVDDYQMRGWFEELPDLWARYDEAVRR